MDLNTVLKKDVVVYIKTVEEHSLLQKLYKDKKISIFLCAWKGAYCYSLNQNLYSSSSSATDSGGFPNCTIILAENIINTHLLVALEPLIFN